MFDWIWGVKTVAIFDIWTIEHFLSGVSVGAFVFHSNSGRFKKLATFFGGIFHSRDHGSILRFDLIFLLGVAYFWETIEHYLETGLAVRASNIGFKVSSFGRIAFSPIR